jgi:hypothetical protein
MLIQLGTWIIRILECMFFAGLIGCAFVVVLSWISILKDGFSDD